MRIFFPLFYGTYESLLLWSTLRRQQQIERRRKGARRSKADAESCSVASSLYIFLPFSSGFYPSYIVPRLLLLCSLSSSFFPLCFFLRSLFLPVYFTSMCLCAPQVGSCAALGAKRGGETTAAQLCVRVAGVGVRERE